jgi:biopolymer transport protein ExbB
MIGLVGTLMGMINSFKVISMYATSLPPEKVAKGISQALVLTLLGVGLSIPAIWLFSTFRNRISVITTTAGLEADQFLRHFAHAARAKGPAPGVAMGPGPKVAPRLE